MTCERIESVGEFRFHNSRVCDTVRCQVRGAGFATGIATVSSSSIDIIIRVISVKVSFGESLFENETETETSINERKRERD